MDVQSFSNSNSVFAISEKCVNIMTFIDEATKGENTQTMVTFDSFNALLIFTIFYDNIENPVLAPKEKVSFPWEIISMERSSVSSTWSIDFKRKEGEFSKKKMEITFSRVLEKLTSNWNEANVKNYQGMSTRRTTQNFTLYIKEEGKCLTEEIKLINAMTNDLNLFNNDLVAENSWKSNQPAGERHSYIWVSRTQASHIIDKFDFRFNDVKIAKLFSMIVLLSDEYLQLKTPEDEGKDQNFHRFFEIAIQLPFELQTALANKSYGEKRTVFVRSSLLDKVLMEEFSNPV